MTTVLPSSSSPSRKKTIDDSSTDKLVDPEASLDTTISVEDVPPLGIPISDDVERRPFWKRRKFDGDDIATQPSVFDDPATLETYRPPPQYENAHRFDPLFRWAWKEEFVSTISSRSSWRYSVLI